MNAQTTQRLVADHWDLANARRWDDFARLLAPVVRYDVPQTREYIDAPGGYLEMFRTWPGDWQAVVRHQVCEPAKAVTVIDFLVDGQTATGISVFEIVDGRIAAVTDYWPEPYDPPPRTTALMKRRPA